MSLKQNLLLFFITFELLFLSTVESEQKKIRTGDHPEDNSNEFPYIVRLERHTQNKQGHNGLITKSHVCTASVVSATWSITAQHCIKGTYMYKFATRKTVTNPFSNDAKLVLSYASLNSRDGKEDSTSEIIKYSVCPTKFAASLGYEDLILLQTQVINIKDFGKISAVDYTSIYGQAIKTAGYGLKDHTERTVDTNTEPTMTLRVTDGMLVKCDKTDAQSSYPSICIAPSCAHSVWQYNGDTGGPVLHPSGIIGVNSRSLHHTNKQALVATPISLYIDWITNVMVNEKQEF